MHLTQAEADHLLALIKLPLGNPTVLIPTPGQRVRVELESLDGQERFILDMHRGKIDLMKGTYQTRARSAIPLARLDFGGAPHRNPDGAEVSSPHLHLYREGYDLRWAVALDPSQFTPNTMIAYWPFFQQRCSIHSSLTLSDSLI